MQYILVENKQLFVTIHDYVPAAYRLPQASVISASCNMNICSIVMSPDHITAGTYNWNLWKSISSWCIIGTAHNGVFKGQHTLPFGLKGRFYANVAFYPKGKILCQSFLYVLNGKILCHINGVKSNSGISTLPYIHNKRHIAQHGAKIVTVTYPFFFAVNQGTFSNHGNNRTYSKGRSGYIQTTCNQVISLCTHKNIPIGFQVDFNFGLQLHSFKQLIVGLSYISVGIVFYFCSQIASFL